MDVNNDLPTSKDNLDNVADNSADERDVTVELEHLRRIEAALFIAGRFLGLKELVALTDINPILLRKLLGDLGDRYKDSAIEIVNKGDMWKMDVSADYLGMVNRLATGSTEFTKAEQESLAIIAFKQPIKQSVMIKIRGNKGYDHIKKFVQLGLLQKKRSGHTWELSLKDEFYDYFHMHPDQQLADSP